jgi:hypothetical protein
MVAPIELYGAVPLFYPIGRDALPDLEWLHAHTTADCSALLAVHFFGLPVSLDAVREFCNAKRILLIEDCAHAFFGEVAGRSVGSWGDFVIASLPKFFAMLEGGVLVGPEPELAELRLARAGTVSEFKAVWNLLESAALHNRLPGLNALLRLASKAVSAVPRGNINARDGGAQPRDSAAQVRLDALADDLVRPMYLRHAEKWLFGRLESQRITAQRRENYRCLSGLIPNEHGVTPLFPDLPQGAVPYVFPLWLQEPDAVYSRLRERAFPVLRWDRYWPGAIDASHDVGRNWGHHLVQILCHQDLTSEDMRLIASGVLQEAHRAGARFGPR